MLSTALSTAINSASVSRLHRAMRAEGVPCVDVGPALLALLGNFDSPLTRALHGICTDADRSGEANAYHNPAHSKEVGVNWFCLALLNNQLDSRDSEPLDSHRISIGLCAAFGHDLEHDGRGNTGPRGVYRPIWLETIAAERVAERMQAAGVSSEDVALTRCAILLTDPRCGYPVLEASLKPGFDLGHAVSVRPEFSCLGDPLARLICAMLRDADLMPSAAMPARDHDERTREMLSEHGLGGTAPDRKSTAAFLSGLVGGRFLSPAGARFQGDLDRLIALNAARGERSGPLWVEGAERDNGDAKSDGALIAALGLHAVVGAAPDGPTSS